MSVETSCIGRKGTLDVILLMTLCVATLVPATSLYSLVSVCVCVSKANEEPHELAGHLA